MKLLHITASETEIRFQTDGNAETVTVYAYSPAIAKCTGEKPVTMEIVHFDHGYGAVPRDCGGRDGLFLRWEMKGEGGEEVPGKKYVETLDFIPKYDDPYPQTDSKKGLQVCMIEDAISLGVRHAALNVCIGDLMRPAGTENTIIYHHDGRDYYFDRNAVARHDASIKELSDAGIIITLILLNSKHWTLQTPKELEEILYHPGFVPYQDLEEVHLSAFNMTSDEGCRYFCAFVAFLTERYTNPAQPYGRAVGLIISNEINSQWYWGNAGEMTCEGYMYEYTTALRLAWQTATSIYKNARIYISLDHFWCGSQDANQPLKYYGSRDCLTNLNRYALAEGNFYWNIAHHPYPEDLRYPDFWNDQSSTDDEDTMRITFKNLKLLAQFLYKEEFQYNGIRRRIILSEQGFNSHWTEESEILQACAYGRAYRICMEIPEVDSFILHAHCDNRYEFGLNLGIWRRHEDSSEMDRPKPIYYVFRAIDKKDESGKFHWERY